MRRMRPAASRTAVASLATALLVLAGCDGDDDDSPADTSALAAEAPSGARLCGFVPSESVTLALGAGEFDADEGYLSRNSSDDVLSGAACGASVDGDDVLSINVTHMLGYAGNGFRDALASDEYNHLPDAVGPGYSWTDEPDGDDEPAVGETRLSRGDYLIKVWVAGIAEGRDPEADAVALAQQAVQTLDIPDEWTLPGEPPAR